MTNSEKKYYEKIIGIGFFIFFFKYFYPYFWILFISNHLSKSEILGLMDMTSCGKLITPVFNDFCKVLIVLIWSRF